MHFEPSYLAAALLALVFANGCANQPRVAAVSDEAFVPVASIPNPIIYPENGKRVFAILHANATGPYASVGSVGCGIYVCANDADRLRAALGEAAKRGEIEAYVVGYTWPTTREAPAKRHSDTISN